jgi:hypothetical protein
MVFTPLVVSAPINRSAAGVQDRRMRPGSVFDSNGSDLLPAGSRRPLEWPGLLSAHELRCEKASGAEPFGSGDGAAGLLASVAEPLLLRF